MCRGHHGRIRHRWQCGIRVRSPLNFRHNYVTIFPLVLDVDTASASASLRHSLFVPFVLGCPCRVSARRTSCNANSSRTIHQHGDSTLIRIRFVPLSVAAVMLAVLRQYPLCTSPKKYLTAQAAPKICKIAIPSYYTSMSTADSEGGTFTPHHPNARTYGLRSYCLYPVYVNSVSDLDMRMV